MSIEVRERQAVALIFVFIKGNDGISQAARFADDGHGAVSQGDELTQSARFIPRGHEEDIRRRIDAVRQAFVEHDVGRYLCRIAAGQIAEGFFILPVAGPDDNQLYVVFDELVHNARYQIHALVFDEARYHGDHGHAALDAQPQFLAQGVLVDALAGAGVLRRIRLGNIGVRFGIIGIFVEAVDNADDLVLIAADIAVQPFAEVRIGNFLSVRRADRRDVVGVDHARFHVVDAAVAFQIAVVEQVLRQADDILHDRRRINPLIFQVMNGIDEFHIFVEIVMVEIFLQEDAQHTRMPVVAVNDVGLEADARQHRQHGAAEIGEPFVVVGIAVQAVALEVPFIVDEIYLDAVHIDFVDAVVQLTPGQVDDPRRHLLHLLLCFVFNQAVFRNDQADVHALGGQFLR